MPKCVHLSLRPEVNSMTKRPSSTWLLTRPKPEPSYLKCLKFFWQGEEDSALALLSNELSESENLSSEPFYRLWIEVLANEKADAGLRELIAHLERNIELGLLANTSGTALIALSHYELGEREAAVMLWRSVSKFGNDAYARELAMVLSEDDEVKEQAAHTLMRISGDYLHLRRATLFFHSENIASAYRKSIGTLTETFAGNPLHNEIRFHHAFSKKRFEAAFAFAKTLRNDFAQHNEYQFFYAYCAYLTKNTSVAMHEFESLNRKVEGTDPDILHMLGLAVQQEAKGKPEEYARSRNFLNRSKSRYQTLGYPALQLEDSLMNLSTPKFKAESARYWVVKLTQKQSWDLSQRSDDAIRTLHKSMGEFVERGDYCFFVTENRLSSEKAPGLWRLHALYRATTNPEWHPTHRFKTSLELVVRPEVSVPIEVEGNAFQSASPAAAYGLLEIEPSALQHFEEAVQEYTLEDPKYSEVFDTIRYSRAG